MLHGHSDGGRTSAVDAWGMPVEVRIAQVSAMLHWLPDKLTP